MSFEYWADALRVSSRLRDQARSTQKLNEKKLYRIRQYRASTNIIFYPQMKEAFDYVHKLYPNVGVCQATVYHTTKTVLNEVGYKGVGGFYDTKSRVIVISDDFVPTENYDESVSTEFTLDEVLCHELIHFAANFFSPVSTRCVEEEIAYGKSINYLRFKGRTDDFIIRKNMMPYLVSVVDKYEIMHKLLREAYPNQLPDIAAISDTAKELLVKQMAKKMEKAIIEESYTIGQKMIALYGDNKVEPEVEAKQTGRNLIMDGE